MLVGTLLTPLTVLFGWRWWWGMDVDATPQMQVHQWLGTALAGVYAVVALWRGRVHVKGHRPTWVYLVVLLLVTVALWIQGHIGAALSYGTLKRFIGYDALGLQSVGLSERPVFHPEVFFFRTINR